eukprot:scaffold2436_cov249-Pinguiococcus_pyrenoidosus.AAC.1
MLPRCGLRNVAVPGRHGLRARPGRADRHGEGWHAQVVRSGPSSSMAGAASHREQEAGSSHLRGKLPSLVLRPQSLQQYAWSLSYDSTGLAAAGTGVLCRDLEPQCAAGAVPRPGRPAERSTQR